MAETRVTATASWQSMVSGPKTVIIQNQSSSLITYALESSAPGASVLGLTLRRLEFQQLIVPSGFNLYVRAADPSNSPVVVCLDMSAVQAQTQSFSITRTNDVNAYGAFDVIGASVGASAAQTFTAIGQPSSQIRIIGTELEIDATALIASEAGYNLYLYNVTPPSALADNVAWDLPSGDRSAFLGLLALGTPVDLGSTLYVKVDNLNVEMAVPASGNLFAYLVTIAAHTPTASRVYKVTLHTVPA